MKTRHTILVLLPLMVLLSSCVIRYRFNGASIDYTKVQSISIAEFPNNAPMVNPSLSSDLTEGIRDIFRRQTRLQVKDKDGDMELEGEITNYFITPMAISADSYSAQTKLTVNVRVRFTNNKAPEESFDKTYTAFQLFDSSSMLNDVQDELCAAMIKEIADNIFNDSVARW